ncbi:hypothetical protein BDM02DRAFT_3136795 [Thelephora ganbajun]|uniref:Uncharacterized protein n=1 Tax=Thelephora ganbajun TaxID=370292 RepID=A0ACB6ZTR1_THEGA|nr:hypothetical protein BDM02DRAFT_3136795 [Thelephora ganbajun]
MPQDIMVTFLGTSSGGGPTKTRNCSSLIVDMLGDGTLWMVDCAEGTSRQFELQPPVGHKAKRGRVATIFVTHMHADHTMGLIGFLKAQLGIPRAGVKPVSTTPSPDHITFYGAFADRWDSSIAQVLKMELYGPAGLRAFIRTILNMTDSQCQDKYVVHELLGPGEQPSAPCKPGSMRANEMGGRDIVCGDDGFWRECVKVWSHRAKREIVVDAGRVVHRVPCLGYVIRESPTTWDTKGKDEEAQATALGRLRKLVLLGDTNDPDGIIPLVNSSPGHVALAVHEATDCYIPDHVDPQQQTGKNRTTESVHSISLQRGHSTPGMAGKFANEIGARRLVLNHLGGRFPAPGRSGNRDSKFRENVMGWIEQQATEAWAPEQDGAKAQAAVDFLTVFIKPIPVPETEQAEPQIQWTQMDRPSSSTSTSQNSGQTSGHGRRYGRYTSGPPTPNEKDQRKPQRTERQAEKRREDVV